MNIIFLWHDQSFLPKKFKSPQFSQTTFELHSKQFTHLVRTQFPPWIRTGVSFTVQRRKLNLNWIKHYTARQKIYYNWSNYFSQFIRKNSILKHIAQTPPPLFLIMKRHSINDITYPSVGLSQVIFHQLALNNTQILNDSTKSNSHRRQQTAEQYFYLMQIIIIQ